MTDANPSRQIRAASSLERQLEPLGVEDRHVRVELVIPSRMPSTSAEIRSPFLASTTK